MNILITGASRGLGKEMARILRLNGATVFTPTRQELDVKYMSHIEKYRINALDLIINNAGGIAPGGFDPHMDLNARGPYLVTECYWHLLVKSKGRVINISSREGLSGDTFGNRLYSVSKAALNAVTRMQAKNEDGVCVNACCPGPFDSSSAAECFKAADTPIWMALEMDRSITGKFFINRQVVPW